MNCQLVVLFGSGSWPNSVLLPAAGAADSPDHWAGELDEADEEAEDETSAEDEDGDGRDREAVLDPDEVRVVIREGPPIDEL